MFFKGLSLILAGFEFWRGEGGWPLGYHSVGFSYFPHIS